MKAVYKFPLELTDEQVIYVPGGTSWKPRHVGYQGQTLCLWAEVAIYGDRSGVNVYIHGTGHPIHPDASLYVGTIFGPLGLVFHVYTGSEV